MSGGDAPVLSMRDVSVVRGRRDVLRVAALDVAPGETVAVLGPNGAGKSTMLLTAALLLPVAAGEVRLFGESPRRSRDRVRLRRGTATVFQEPALLDMPARRNVEIALALHGVPRGERTATAEHWLERLGVTRLAGARPHTLSGGEAQRVALARAFSVRPRLLFLDEPFSSLDPGTRAQLVGELRALLAVESAAALIATHDHGEAHLLADRTVVLLDGEVAREGPTEDVFHDPRTPAVAAFLGYSVVDAPGLRQRLALARGRPGQAFVPPGAVVLGDGPAALDAVVLAVEGALGEARLVVDAGERLAARVSIEEIRAHELRAGVQVRLNVDPERVVWP
jgi:tungstate transport system ATP-binding protein